MKNKKVLNMTLISMGAVVIALCSLITIPAAIPFTLQTFGVFAILYNLGGKRGFLSILVYIALGLCGIPVFANFGVGIGALIGPTGGYILGFAVGGAFYWMIEHLFGKKFIVKLISLLCVTVIYYICGTALYIFWSASSGNTVGILTAFTVCVAPYLLFDIIKLSLVLIKRISYLDKFSD